MSILNLIAEDELWKNFFAGKDMQGKLRAEERKALSLFIDEKRYKKIAEALLAGQSFSLPRKRLLNKKETAKKRVVYTYSQDENYVLKLMTQLLYKYDWAFSSNLYSFRRNFGVKKAFFDLIEGENHSDLCSYKVDIHDYFNSIDVERCIAELEEVIADDEPLLRFIAGLLREPKVIYDDVIVSEAHGIMAGVPISSFLANIYLRKMDRYFEERNILYARYSDDIIVFAPSLEELEEYICTIKAFLEKYQLEINPKKEIRTAVGGAWTFLGMQYQNGKVDIAPASLDKVKAKLRRKARALLRWKRKKGLSNIHAVKAFIKYINHYFYNNTRSDEMTWTRWYFPVLTTDQSLKVLDAYSLELIRYIFSEKHTKSAYNFRYEEIKQLGYRPLVAEFYKNLLHV